MFSLLVAQGSDLLISDLPDARDEPSCSIQYHLSARRPTHTFYRTVGGRDFGRLGARKFLNSLQVDIETRGFESRPPRHDFLNPKEFFRRKMPWEVFGGTIHSRAGFLI